MSLLTVTGRSRFQSTHPRGVRLGGTNIQSFESVFQSTHPRGVRLHIVTQGSRTTEFQSTHPRGVRRPSWRTPAAFWCFNPRTHEGCDEWNIPCHSSCRVSIHAPTRGATRGKEYFESMCKFQSTHPRGVRQDLSVSVGLA